MLKRVVERHHEATTKPLQNATSKATPGTTRKASRRGIDAATRAAIEAARQGQPAPSARALARNHHIGRDKAGEVRAAVLAEANGHAGTPGQLYDT